MARVDVLAGKFFEVIRRWRDGQFRHVVSITDWGHGGERFPEDVRVRMTDIVKRPAVNADSAENCIRAPGNCGSWVVLPECDGTISPVTFRILMARPRGEETESASRSPGWLRSEG